jgi:hypothetical protein
MSIAAAIDHTPRPALVGVMVLGFILCWPVGVATLAYLIWSGKMGCGHHRHWEHGGHWGAERWRERMMERRARWEEKLARHGFGPGAGPKSTSGNHAFDEYRADTLRRLEEEEKEFREFVDKLRFAKDKAEFDEFLANRRPPASPDAAPTGN